MFHSAALFVITVALTTTLVPGLSIVQGVEAWWRCLHVILQPLLPNKRYARTNCINYLWQAAAGCQMFVHHSCCKRAQHCHMRTFHIPKQYLSVGIVSSKFLIKVCYGVRHAMHLSRCHAYPPPLSSTARVQPSPYGQPQGTKTTSGLWAPTSTTRYQEDLKPLPLRTSRPSQCSARVTLCMW
jgi:hypothetical protein